MPAKGKLGWASDLVGATPLDRSEDVRPNPVNGWIYTLLTNMRLPVLPWRL
jgi:secreted PhoX family phosphatase